MRSLLRRSCRALLAALALSAVTGPALAHPHVWVTTRAEVVYGSDGRVAGLRHRWTFDEGYSSYLTQGLDKNGDGKLTPDELAGLAKENTESLADFEYFTQLKINGARQAFEPPREPAMEMESGKAVLSFFLPVKGTAPLVRTAALEVYDPTFFVSFTLAEGDDAVRLANAPKGCATTVTRPKPPAAPQDQKLSESFFDALTSASNFGGQYANRAIVACP
ncbi:MAG TPA: DUF1007 family protein [Beijerinckiaceae bacterium]|jgi:ABC-type uncharacterized transport system substrate-binding protein